MMYAGYFAASLCVANFGATGLVVAVTSAGRERKSSAEASDFFSAAASSARPSCDGATFRPAALGSALASTGSRRTAPETSSTSLGTTPGA